MDFETPVKQALAQLKKTNVDSVFVNGRNKDIEMYYDIWRGVPRWLDYKYKLPNGNEKQAKLKTLNLPRYLCRTWANNYANEDTTITIPEEKSNERLQEILQNNNFFGRFNNFTEMFMGLGIGATVVEIDVLADEDGNITIKDDSKTKIRMVPGRRVIPITIDDGEVTECAFISYKTGGARLTIHYLVDSTYHVATIEGNYNARGNIEFNIEKRVDVAVGNIPLFQIWHPNLTDEDEIDKCFGTSIFATALDTFKHLDLGYTAYYKEIKLGQKVKFLSNDVIDYDADGNPIYSFDEEDESIFFVKDASADGKATMQEFNGELRIEALTKYINTNLNCAAMLCGLGQTQFEFDSSGGRPIQTATGVIAKQTELYRNVVKQENLATTCFRGLVMAIAYVNNTFTKGEKINIKSINDIQVMYDDNIVEDTASKKEAELKEVQAGIMSIAEYRSHWYDEDYETSLEFVQENGLLLDKYILALQSNVITPEMFVELTFGENYKYKNELVTYITEKTSESNTTPIEDDLDDESDEDEGIVEPKGDGE